MLEPEDRRLLLEALRPPAGYELDHAVGTTFTLDLLALLTAPLAFTLFDLEQEENGAGPDPLVLLKAARDHAENVTIFCEGGRISVPPDSQLLYSNLEGSVVEVRVQGGTFHPKLWVLRFTAPSGPPQYRLLCLSRNLTFDRSWDTILRLDGTLRRRRNAYAVNHPLGDFLDALPGMALRGSIPSRRRAAIERIQDEIRRVEFELPEGFESFRFWPLGIDGHRRLPFGGDVRRMLVVSPFVGGEALRRLGVKGTGHVLATRPESLDRLEDRDAIEPFTCKVLDDAAEAELDAEAKGDEEGGSAEANVGGEALRGLHAKVFVADGGWDARAWVGSANATDAAFSRNVEFLVELVGKKSRCGVDAVLHGPAEGVPGLGDLLVDYTPPEEPEIDEVAEALEAEAERLQLYVAEQRLAANVDGPDGEGNCVLTLARRGRHGLRLPSGAALRAWPITQARTFSRPVSGRSASELARFEELSVELLTSFIAFELELRREGRGHTVRFVLNVPLRGAPRGRHDAILRSLLRDKERVLRYLLFVLAEAEGAESLTASDLRAIVAGGEGDGSGWGRAEIPLFEGLIRALDRDPAKLGQIARLIEDLGDGEAAEELLPDGFRQVWEPIWAARRGAR